LILILSEHRSLENSNHDTFQPGPDESLSERRSLASFEDISFDYTPQDGPPGNDETPRLPYSIKAPRRRT